MKRILPALVLLAAATAAHAQIAVGSATPRSGGGNAVFPEQELAWSTGSPGLQQTFGLAHNRIFSTSSRELGPIMAYSSSSWGDGCAWTYEGEMYMEAGTTYAFFSFIDDYATISIDGESVLVQKKASFTSATFFCEETGWHEIVIQMWDTIEGELIDIGSEFIYEGNCYGPKIEGFGIGFNATAQTSQEPLSGWRQLIDPGDGSLFRTKTCGPRYSGVRVASQMRENDPTVMDVSYIVYTNPETTPNVNVRALAFEDGARGFATVVRPETFIEGTDVNLGDGIAANVEHHLSWKVSSDWATDLAKVSFEVMAMKPGDLLLPDMHFVTIPEAEGHPKTILGASFTTFWNTSYFVDGIERSWGGHFTILRQDPLLSSLFWLYASKAPELTLVNGSLFANGKVLDNSWESARNTFEFVFSKMGYRLLEDENELEWVNENTRLNLRPRGFWQYAVKTVEE